MKDQEKIYISEGHIELSENDITTFVQFYRGSDKLEETLFLGQNYEVIKTNTNSEIDLVKGQLPSNQRPQVIYNNLETIFREEDPEKIERIRSNIDRYIKNQQNGQRYKNERLDNLVRTGGKYS